MRIAERWGLVGGGLGALGVVGALVYAWVSHVTSSCGDSTPTTLHVKVRAGHHVMAGEMVPLFPRTVANGTPPGDSRARWYRLEVPANEVGRTLSRLEADSSIESALVPPVPELPTTDRPFHEEAGEQARQGSCPITTPSFESYQGYLGPAPIGIDAPAAWRAGVRGQGVWFADVEGGWNAQHEDLPGARMVHVGQRMDGAYWRMHGTAVLGEVVGVDNGRGVVGIAPDVERVVTSSIGGSTAAEAIDAAAENLRAGDVLLIELHSIGPRGRFLPMEFWDDCFDVIQAATARGIVVIEAGGNGAENLDHEAYHGKLRRADRDSGAIMVGAGGPARAGFADRERLDFSNYGTRVDVQGWGRRVATLDYGDLQSCDVTGERHYTDEFSGTSSASPIVAGAAILVQSYAKAHGRLLTPAEVRQVLHDTGTPQAGDARDAIGPRPDLARALEALRP